jgi:HlyD family secretion protein
MKKISSAAAVFLTLAGLNGCLRPSDPSVARSALRIEVAKRGDLQLPTGLLKQTIYIEKPALCACDPNTEGKLFVLDADGRSATQVNVQYGQSAGMIVEVRDGIKPGDKVIISDMYAYDGYCFASRANICRIELR